MPVSERTPGTAETAVYEPPTVTRLGTLAELTLGDMSGSDDAVFGAQVNLDEGSF
jgi:hypothetical protein